MDKPRQQLHGSSQILVANLALSNARLASPILCLQVHLLPEKRAPEEIEGVDDVVSADGRDENKLLNLILHP